MAQLKASSGLYSFGTIGETGFGAGGQGPTSFDEIYKFPFSAPPVTGSDHGELTFAHHSGAGHEDGTTGYTSGGVGPGTARNSTIQSYSFYSPVTSTDIGELTYLIDRTRGLSSPTDGWTVGGYGQEPPLPAPFGEVTTIQKFPFSLPFATATDVDELSTAKANTFPHFTTTEGFVSGGGAIPNVIYDTVEKFPFTSPFTIVTDVGELTTGRVGGAPSQSTTEGYLAGGVAPGPVVSDSIVKYPFSTPFSTYTDLTELSSPRYQNHGNSSETKGYSVNGFPNLDTIEEFPFSAPVTATDIGELGSTLRNRAPGNLFTPDTSNVPYSILQGAIKTKINASDFGSGTIGDVLIRSWNFNKYIWVPAPSLPLDHPRGFGLTYGYAAGGFIETPNPFVPTSSPTLNIQRFPFSAAPITATDIGEIAANTQHGAGVSSSSNGYIAGGYEAPPAPYATIQSYPFSAPPVTATNIGDLAVPITPNIGTARMTGAGSPTDGYVAGGFYPGPTAYDVINKFPFSSPFTNATDVGELVTTTYEGGSAQSNIEAYVITGLIGPGTPASSPTDVVQKYPFTSPPITATDVGELAVPVYGQGFSSGERGFLTFGGSAQNIYSFPLSSPFTTSTSYNSPFPPGARQDFKTNSSADSGWITGGNYTPPTNLSLDIITSFPFYSSDGHGQTDVGELAEGVRNHTGNWV